MLIWPFWPKFFCTLIVLWICAIFLNILCKYIMETRSPSFLFTPVSFTELSLVPHSLSTYPSSLLFSVFLGVYILYLILYIIFCYLASTFIDTCAESPIKSSYRVTCHAKVTYDDEKLGTRTIGGYMTTFSCDPSSLCASFGKFLKNTRNCSDAFCCRGSTRCSKSPTSSSGDDKPKSGQSSSVWGGASIMLILSTLLANSFAKWYYWYLRNRKHFPCFYIEL